MPRRLRPALPLLTLLACLSVALAAESPQKAGQGAPKASPKEPDTSVEVVDWDPELDPPPGSPADLALWRAGRQVGFDARASKVEASRLQRHIRSNRLGARLRAAAKGRPPEEAGRLAAVEAKLQAGWSENYGVMARTWPVDATRGCAYPWLNFEGALRADAAGTQRNDLTAARTNLRTCVERLGFAVKAMERSNVALAATVAEAERALATVEPPREAPKATAGKAAPPAATARKGEPPHDDEAEEKQESRRD